MEFGTRIFIAFLVSQFQVVCTGSQEEEEKAECVPGFQEKEYQVKYSGEFLKDIPLLQVVFEDCAGNEGVEFEVSNPDFLIDEKLNLVPRRDVIDSGDVMFVHGVNNHVDDMAQVTIMGAPSRSPQTLREILGLSDMMPYRSKRSLLVPPMFVPENQRAPFPRLIGKVSSFSRTSETKDGAEKKASIEEKL
ncbi:cadherin-13-like [Sinocyclocheilus anshuiensis]|uniref:cadherin-13-like n=1 Tax=Sinocyclocheilus anshuiensis TaxID=1608454 RepID=UPI0007BA2934|nr:PREDICTED: cadherin-13-like [Sinocyclocheilus anshuiensis]